MRAKLVKLIGERNICPSEANDYCIKCEYRGDLPCWAGIMADRLIANGVTFADDNNVGDKVEKLQKKIKALEKSNRNWRRKCQRLRNPLEATCEGCIWANRKRPQKCSCCRRNADMKDCYEVEA